MKTKRRKFKSLRELFRAESRWTQWASARDTGGFAVWEKSPRAVSWCLLGGVNKVYPPIKRRAVLDKLVAVANQDIASFNDSPDTTIEHIRLVVKEAKV